MNSETNMLEILESILKPDTQLYELEKNIYSVLPEEQRKSDYDFKANFYDFVIGNAFYNKIVWGNSLINYNNFCKNALLSRKDGIVLDAGAGSLVFTAEAYAEYKERPVIILDRSQTMLAHAKKRLIKLNKGEFPQNIILLQADIFNLPFQPEQFTTINSHGTLHVFADMKNFLDALNNVLAQDGQMYFLVLLAENFAGKFFTKAAKLTGEISHSLTSRELEKIIADSGYTPQINVIGNIGYVKISGKNQNP